MARTARQCRVRSIIRYTRERAHRESRSATVFVAEQHRRARIDVEELLGAKSGSPALELQGSCRGARHTKS
eukprot:6199690-Pleurochrysis_carterae.AAC.2